MQGQCKPNAESLLYAEVQPVLEDSANRMQKACFMLRCSLSSRCNYLELHRKGTAKKSFPQEGTFWWDSYQKVGIVMLSGFCEGEINLD